MHRDEHSDAALSFGPFRLFPSERLLECDGTPVQIGGRALDILVLLAERAGEVVSKGDIVARVWSDVTVDEGSLRFHITALRKALGDGKDGARYVTNVPGRGYCLVAPLTGATQRRVAGAPPRGSTPPGPLPTRLARMIGRDEAVRKIAEALSAHRFVTVVGPGGIGKTTVATAAGHTLAPSFDGQVAFVDLGLLEEPRLVAATVASALGVTVGSADPSASIIAFAQDTRLLLILDGCEHVIEPVAVLAEAFFHAAPTISLLATSRESLRVEGEHVHRLFPLQCPPQGAELSAAAVLEFPAVQLFIERATAASGGFELTDADASAVAGLCQRLDGIPLALELAAARFDAFGIKGLAAGLDDRLLLTSKGRRTAMPRHQTLKATLDWSYDRLPATERALLNRLSIFNGTFTLRGASAVCSGDDLPESDIPDGVIDLVAKSMVAVNLGSDTAYRLLDTTRYYAGEKLAGSGEQQAVAERHARYIRELFEAAAAGWQDQPSIEWLATYRPQLDNLRAALKWAFSEAGDQTVGVALAIAAVPLWSQLSLVDESLDWVRRALSAANGLPEPDRRWQMQLHAALGGLQMYAISTVKQSSDDWETALAIAAELGETDYELRALRALWAESINGGEFRRALPLAERFQESASRADSADDQIVSDRLIGTTLHFLGEQDQALAATERMLGRYVPSPARSQLVRYQFNQKVAARIIRERVLWLQGRTETALRDIEDNVAEALTLDHTLSLCLVLTQSGCPIPLLAGDHEAAQRYTALLIDCTAARALDIFYTYAVCFEAGLEIESGKVEAGLDRLQPAIEELRRSGFGHYRTSFLMMRARAQILLERYVDAAATIDEAIGTCLRTGEAWCLPELHRLSGEIVLGGREQAAMEAAVDAFQRALTLAREQRAIAWELRAATSLVRCLANDPRIDAARIMLRQIVSRFNEGHGRPDLAAAVALLDAPLTTPRIV